ncbi:unnamed protein product [Adineta steineri]|uniref:Shisa N-terminal domain-containing protein n=2 Tax=Adineta steineri TaxID=433720 RepID=A0A818QR42_9BILA|nr:unnamed protein product [Adineta steineri]
MENKHLYKCFYFLLLMMLSLVEVKGKGAARRVGSFARPTGYGQANKYYAEDEPTTTVKPSAETIAAEAEGYAIMSALSASFHSQPNGLYGPGYGGGETCMNTQRMPGHWFGSFRCPVNGFPYEATNCCGVYGKHYCCIPKKKYSFLRISAYIGLIVLIIVILFIIILLVVRHYRQRHKGMTAIPIDEQNT